MARSNVKRVQQALNDNGAKLKVDGWFGDQCEKEVYKQIGVNTNQIGFIRSEPKTAHFSLSEFRCKDGTDVPIELWDNLQNLMNELEELRAELCKVYGGKRAIHIHSGYRTLEYNREKGNQDTSQHVVAKAADIKVDGLTPKQVYVVADRIFTDGGVGIYEKFVHVDIKGENRRWDKRS